MRSRAKKTLTHRRAAPALPGRAIDVYETLRDQVARGEAHPEGLGAIVFHGMWCGLIVLLQVPLEPTSSRANSPSSPTPVVHDPQLVRLLANMVLLTQSKVEYAY